jgi:ubiquinone/menaquinone biosynthesis C-methylase UbiE
MPEPEAGALERLNPSAVGLTRLSARLSFSSAGEALYRSLLRLVELTPDSEFLLVPSGRGRSARFVAESTGAAGAGADPDAEMVAVATDRAKAKGLTERLHFEHAPLDDLPYQDDVFDLALGEIELAAAEDPAPSVRELVRVTRPGGIIVLIQLVWLRPLEAPGRTELVQRLGIRPLMLVEWKQILKDAGVVDIQVDDWSDAAAPPHRVPVLGGLSELFTFRARLRILPRAWRRWGWRGVRAVLSREVELRRLLHNERVLGVAVIRGYVRRDDETNGEQLPQ